MIDLKKAEEFHGHLGPYLVLGLRAGELALEKLDAKKYFGIEVTVQCPDEPPPRCFVDGLQLSTGATYGKANIRHITRDKIRVTVKNKKTGKLLEIQLNFNIQSQPIPQTETELENLSQKIMGMNMNELFDFHFVE